MLSLQPANPGSHRDVAKVGVLMGVASGALILAGDINVVRGLFPGHHFNDFREYDVYIYAALAISVISGAFLILIRKVIAVSFAQLGAITSLIYIFTH